MIVQPHQPHEPHHTPHHDQPHPAHDKQDKTPDTHKKGGGHHQAHRPHKPAHHKAVDRPKRQGHKTAGVTALWTPTTFERDEWAESHQCGLDCQDA